MNHPVMTHWLQVVALIVWLPWLGCGPPEMPSPPLPSVTVENAEQKDVTTYTPFAGQARAKDTVDIYARVKGYLRSIDFVDGQRVQQGDLLFTIEPELFQAAVDSARAKLVQAETKLDWADSAYKRKKQGFEAKVTTELDMLSAQAEWKSAKAAVLSARADLTKAKLDLSYTQVTAPMAGRMTRYTMSVGNLVGTPEQTLLARLVVESPIDVFFNVDERALLPYLREGIDKETPNASMPDVVLELADGIRHDEPGRVNYIDPEMDPSTGTLTVHARFDNKDLKLFPGLYTKVLLPEAVNNAVLVPDIAIQRDLTGTFVLTLDDTDTVVPKYIETGVLVDTKRIITKGITPQDRVIVKGIQRARPGSQVRVTDPNQPSATDKTQASTPEPGVTAKAE